MNWEEVPVAELRPGTVALSAYVEQTVIPVTSVVPLPDTIDDRTNLGVRSLLYTGPAERRRASPAGQGGGK